MPVTFQKVGTNGFTMTTLEAELSGLGVGTVSDAVYDATDWNDVTTVAPSKNAIRDYLATLGSAAFVATSAFDAAGAADAKVSDAAYDATGWNGVTTIAPSKNAVRDYLATLGSAAFVSTSAFDAAGSAAAAQAASQPLDADLTSIAGLNKTGNALKVIRVNAGENAYELAAVSGSSADDAPALYGFGGF